MGKYSSEDYHKKDCYKKHGHKKDHDHHDKCRGPTGATGPKGAAGSQGPKGATGSQGPKGATGSQGPRGDVGCRGTQGCKGDQGCQGPRGCRGKAGATGAAGAAGANGATGATGAAGANGATGATGAAGAQGIQGIQGIQGTPGVIGPTGPAGPVATQRIAAVTLSATGLTAVPLNAIIPFDAAEFVSPLFAFNGAGVITFNGPSGSVIKITYGLSADSNAELALLINGGQGWSRAIANVGSGIANGRVSVSNTRVLSLNQGDTISIQVITRGITIYGSSGPAAGSGSTTYLIVEFPYQ